jgi:hypothetical protein
MGATWARYGRGIGAAWARHDMCKLAFRKHVAGRIQCGRDSMFEAYVFILEGVI